MSLMKSKVAPVPGSIPFRGKPLCLVKVYETYMFLTLCQRLVCNRFQRATCLDLFVAGGEYPWHHAALGQGWAGDIGGFWDPPRFGWEKKGTSHNAARTCSRGCPPEQVILGGHLPSDVFGHHPTSNWWILDVLESETNKYSNNTRNHWGSDRGSQKWYKS